MAIFHNHFSIYLLFLVLISIFYLNIFYLVPLAAAPRECAYLCLQREALRAAFPVALLCRGHLRVQLAPLALKVHLQRVPRLAERRHFVRARLNLRGVTKGAHTNVCGVPPAACRE